MKTNTYKTIVLALIGVTAISMVFTVEAISKSETLGASSLAIDVYSFFCPKGTVHARIRISDTNRIINPVAAVYATFGKDKTPTLTTALDQENFTTPTPWVTNSLDGSGTYALMVRKDKSNPDDYSVEAVCLNNLNKPNGPATLNHHINQ
jgi:hypothetical protein